MYVFIKALQGEYGLDLATVSQTTIQKVSCGSSVRCRGLYSGTLIFCKKVGYHKRENARCTEELQKRHRRSIKVLYQCLHLNILNQNQPVWKKKSDIPNRFWDFLF